MAGPGTAVGDEWHDVRVTDRLSATDAAFLYAEDAGSPMHVGGVVILGPTRASEGTDGEAGPVGFRYEEIVSLIESRLSLVPRYRQKVRFVPGRLARPVWVDDEDFDVTYHVRRSALPKPGTDAELDHLVGRLISRPLDRSRPLWEVYVIEGLSGGRVALVNKTHHAMVDRIGAVDVAAAILDVSRQARVVPEQPWIPDPSPSDVDLVVDAVADLATRPTDVLDVVRYSALDARAAAGRVVDTAGRVLSVLARTVAPAPRSLLNDTRSGQRRFVTVRADLADFKAVRRAHGGSVNDGILTVVAGALRSWLLAHGEPVVTHTVVRAMVPVSVSPLPGPAGSAGGEGGGHGVQSVLLDLPVAESNPVMRLHQVSFAMESQLETGSPMTADALVELGRFAPPTLHALGARMAGQLSKRLYNLLITNVPGPQIPLYAAGYPVEAMYPVAPLGLGQAIAVSCTSYRGGVFFGVTADREAIPDIDDFSIHITEAVEELRSTVPPTVQHRAAPDARAEKRTPRPRSRAGTRPAPRRGSSPDAR